VISGDLIFNALWNPNAKTYVAIAGELNLGAGNVDMPGLMRMLERQNIIVDAYIDPRDGAVKGPGITRRTDFLVLGELFRPRTRDGAKGQEVANKANESLKKMLDEARENALTVVNPRRFVNETGFRLKRTDVQP
jgi:hypothetical protein